MIAIVKPTQEEHKLIMDFFPSRLPEVLDWSIIMQIVEKIETLETEFDGRFRVEITHHTCIITGNKSLFSEQWEKVYNVSVSHDSKLEAVYDAVIQFINWYNQNPPNNERSSK
jgi:hypothetical protein